jgi:hypothetical protein
MSALVRWSQWRSLPGTERRTLVAFALALPLVDVAIRILGLNRTCAAMRWGNRRVLSRPAAPNDVAYANRLAELADIAGRHGLYTITCLRQAVLVQHWLQRQGWPAELRIGALKNAAGDLQAHAWVELGGTALAQRDLAYAPLQEMSSAEFSRTT